MKKKVVALMLGVMIAITVAACGNEKGKANVDGTEVVESTETESQETIVSASGAFDLNAEDYVELCDYNAIEVAITGSYDVSDENVKEYFEQVFQQNGPFYKEDSSKKTIGEGDIVNVDYVGKLDGEAFEGGSAKGQVIDVDKNASVAGGAYIEGFTEGLKGASVGDVIDCDVTFPENYGNEDLAGKAVVFTFTVNSIQKEITIDEIDDTFAKEQFQANTVDEMYEQVGSYLKTAAEYQKRRDTYEAIQNYLLEECKVTVPEDYRAARISDYKNQFIRENCDGDESKLEEYLSTYFGKTLEEAETEWAEFIEDNIRIEFILEAIAKKEGLKLDEKQYKSYVQNMVMGNGYGSEEAMYGLYGYGDVEYGEKYLRKLCVDNMAMEKLMGTAAVTVQEIPEEDTKETEGEETKKAAEPIEETTEAE